MKISDLRSEDFDPWIARAAATPEIPRLFISVSGYESRARFWPSMVRKAYQCSNHALPWVIRFWERPTDGSRKLNDQCFSELGWHHHDLSVDSHDKLQQLLLSGLTHLLAKPTRHGIEVHVDYSSMPRAWYCGAFRTILTHLPRSGRLYMWYSGGKYGREEFPTAGVSDIRLFCGYPTINPPARTHIIGLGFDRIRASAIFRVLDPQSLVCFYGSPSSGHEYASRVRDDNRDLLAAAQREFFVPVGDFARAFALIADVVREYRRLGDVIIVPDGPKPLVLASSLIPDFLDLRGIVSLHVRRRKDESSKGLDIPASGDVSGFSVQGTQ
jgi:hypothetical protein